jgi:hypothetical protein
MDEASGSALDATAGGRNLPNYGNPITSNPGIINTARQWHGGAGGAYFVDTTNGDFQPGANHLSFSFWVNYDSFAGGDTGLLSKFSTPTTWQWIVFSASVRTRCP